MPEISTHDIREWDDERLDNEINEAYRNLFTLRFQHSTRQLENYRTLRTARRTIARLRTIRRERQLQGPRAETVSISEEIE
jgi:large subunit ribosomal protein L29